MFSLLAYAVLGLFIGTLVGFSADSVVKALLPIVFTFAGGSVVAFREKFDPAKLRIALNALLGVGLGGLIGLYSGVVVNEHRLLTPSAVRASELQKLEKPKDGKYLRSDQSRALLDVAQRLRSGTITPADAAAKLEAIDAASVDAK